MRAVFVVSSSPLLLNTTIKYHSEGFMESHKATVENLLQFIYVDEIVLRADSEDKKKFSCMHRQKIISDVVA